MNMNLPARQSTVSDLVEEYDEKNAAIDTVIAEFEAAFQRLEMAASVQGKYVAPVTRHRPHVTARELRSNLLKSGWKAIYDRLQIDMIASAKDKKIFERALEQPAELTFDNAKATFGDYLMRPRYHILRGLAEVFADLDPAYKSHSKVKIGVKGLPKRVIISWGDYSSGYGRDKFRDIVNALAAYQGKPLMIHDEFSAIAAAHGAGEDAVLDGRKIAWKDRYREGEYQTIDRGLTVRKFGNGNAHIFFAPHTMLDINRALAEFYGEVLPDVEPDEDIKRRPCTDVSKDLQFYWTPADVVDRALECAGIYTPRQYSGTPAVYRVLEPSCGDGRILDELRARGCKALGFEFHPGRSAVARAKGHAVVTANFLEQPPTGDFDMVVMNPPFYGRHYAKHVRHALKFLKPGGTLVSILPATARYDHGELDGEWSDLPVGSFAEAGTNIPTVLLKIRAAKDPLKGLE